MKMKTTIQKYRVAVWDWKTEKYKTHRLMTSHFLKTGFFPFPAGYKITAVGVVGTETTVYVFKEKTFLESLVSTPQPAAPKKKLKK